MHTLLRPVLPAALLSSVAPAEHFDLLLAPLLQLQLRLHPLTGLARHHRPFSVTLVTAPHPRTLTALTPQMTMPTFGPWQNVTRATTAPVLVALMNEQHGQSR